MTDRLDAAIRARLEERPCFATHELHDDRARDANGWISHAKAAIVAVLDLHRTVQDGFTHITETAYEAGRRWALEEAVAAIAEKLGVEVDDA